MMVRLDQEMMDATFATLQAAMGDDCVVDLTLTIAHDNATARVRATL